MDYEYFRVEESEQFSFFRIPKALFTEPEFKKLSTDAKLLYGILLDRLSLSRKNGWVDEDGYVFIIYTIEELKSVFQMSHTTIIKLLNELDTEHGIGLIERVRQGCNLPSVIYVKNFVKKTGVSPYGNWNSGFQENGSSECKKVEIRNAKKWKSGVKNHGSSNFKKMERSNTERNKTERNDTEENIKTFSSADHFQTFGRFGNVILSDDEYRELGKLYPADYQQLIEELSIYMKSSGKRYQNHFATVCLWAEKEKKKRVTDDYYEFEEGECL